MLTTHQNKHSDGQRLIPEQVVESAAFLNAQNVEARGSTFSNVRRDQHNHNIVINHPTFGDVLSTNALTSQSCLVCLLK